MKGFFRGLPTLVGVGVLTLLTGSLAKADYSIEVITGAFDSGPIIAGSPFALPSSTTNSVSVDVGALNAFLTGSGFSFVSLGGFDNAASAGPDAQLFQNGGVTRSTTEGNGTITIIATETSFNAPLGAGRTLTSSAADTFGGVFGAGDSRTFQSTFTDGNGATSTPLQTFPASFSSSGSVLTPIATGATAFGLQSTTVIHLGSVTGTDQFSGTTTVRAVPEPGSLALILLGGTALAIRSRRKRLATV